MLFAITGNLGQGKTASMVFLGLLQAVRGNDIYSNIHLKLKYDGKKYPYKYIESPDEIDFIEHGCFLADELWAWLDSRSSQSKKNKISSKILLSSRKRDYNVYYTTQFLHQIDKRIRQITDYEASPVIIPTNKGKLCILDIYQLVAGQRVKLLKRKRFYIEPIFPLYDTNEEISSVD